MTATPREIVRTPFYALELEPGWSAKEEKDGLLLRGGDDTDDILQITALPRVVDAEEMCVLISRPQWERNGGAPPIPQSEKLGTRDGYSATFDDRSHRYVSVVFNFDGKLQLHALCHAPLHRFAAVWAAARRMLSSVARPDHQPLAASGKLTRGLAGLTESWLQRFSEMVKADLKGRGIDATFDEDAVVVGNTRLSLEPVARQCRDAHGYEWSGLIRRYIDAHAGALSGTAADDPFEAMRDRLIVRMYSEGIERGKGIVSRTDLGGVLTALALDLPSAVENVTPQQVETWGRPVDTLFEAAFTNLMTRRVDLRRQKIGDDGDMAVLSQPVAGSSYSLLLDRFPSCVGRKGTFVGIPVREMTVALPFDDAVSVTLLLDGFWQYVRDQYGRDTYSVSPDVFYWDRTVFEPIRIRLEDGIVRVEAGPRLAEHLRRLKRPTLLEVDARDAAGEAIWPVASDNRGHHAIPAAPPQPVEGLPDVALEGGPAAWLERVAAALSVPPERDVPFSGPLGDGTLPLLAEIDGVSWTAFFHADGWDTAAVERLLDFVGKGRAAHPGLCVRIYSTTPLPAPLEDFLLPQAATDFQLEGRLTVRDRPEMNALVFRGLMQKYFALEPPFTLKGLEAVDRIIFGDIPQPVRAQFLPSTINLIACFFGQVMIETQYGEWCRFSRSTLGWGLAFGPPKMGLVRKPDGPVIDVRIVTRQCLQTDKKLSASYWTMQYDIAQMRG